MNYGRTVFLSGVPYGKRKKKKKNLNELFGLLNYFINTFMRLNKLFASLNELNK